ncbi:uncharacterized protein LAESUDRAFT_704656 [Laetiporus sulphureus 93-53]|uniref:Fungal-type protein kinase domain-containing protein n=1 Tax=Laetiporus sulphureus 93-53 TaxID=1314785 RepID=A0A165CSR6_9APHY|nr:uncharacterized protein LAESUDRAFT_704656 [Laetiporus sulphureus 93-53]KZT03372.1 hypothetical protein LAESUDRAFT_704656 [Laetiporus sulphureus 93-53]
MSHATQESWVTSASQAADPPSSESDRDYDEPSSLPASTQQSSQQESSSGTSQASADATGLPHTPENRERSPSSAVKNTPIARNENSTNQHSVDSQDAEARYVRYAGEIQPYVLGPMPCEDFLNIVCRGYPKMSFANMPSPVEAFKDVPRRAEKEVEIYDPFIAAVNGENGVSRCPGIEFKDTSSRAEEQGAGWLKPDVMGYREDLEIPEKETKRKSKSTAAVAHMGYAEIFVEVKRSPDNDFFMDPPENTQHKGHLFILNPSSLSSKDKLRIATKALGQNVAYAAEILARQHRRFLMSISMSGSRIRLFLWDRSGVLVTESFDLHERPEILCRFLWWFSHASEYGRGYDLTVRMSADEEEERKFKDAMTKHVKEQLLLCTSPEDAMRLGKDQAQVEDDKKRLIEALRDHYQPGTVVAADVFHEVQDHEGKVATEVKRVLVSCPVASPKSIATRGTRGYWMMFDDGRVGFLKDTWRHGTKGFEQEGKTIQYLNEHGVHNVPKVLYHGDVKRHGKNGEKYQMTVVHKFTGKDWVCRGTASQDSTDDTEHSNANTREIKVRGHVHYRLVLDIAGYNLHHFADSRELLESTRDVLTATTDAYNANKIHRDLSATNIVLYRHPGGGRRIGYLIDWEFGCNVNRPLGARPWHITGTWQFMSANVLDGDDTYRHVVEDDMESLLYVVLYCAARWTKHNKDEDSLKGFFSKFFDDSTTMDGTSTGGDAKLKNKMKRTYTRRLEFACKPLQDWLTAALDLNNPAGPIVQYPPEWTLEKFAKLWDDALAKTFVMMPDRVERAIPGVGAQTQFKATTASLGPGATSDQEQDDVLSDSDSESTAEEERRPVADTDSKSREQRVAKSRVSKGKQREGQPDPRRGKGRSRQASTSVDQPEASGSAAQDTMDVDAEKDNTKAVHEKGQLRKRRASPLVDNKRTKKTRKTSPRVKASVSAMRSRVRQQPSSATGPSGRTPSPELQASGSGTQAGTVEDVPLRRSTRSRRPTQSTAVNAPGPVARRPTRKPSGSRG